MITNIPATFANTIAPFAPVGRTAVGLEDTDLKSSTFKPTEQMAESVRSQNRRLPDERPNDDVERDRQGLLTRERQAQSGRTSEDLEAEREHIQELSARDREVRAHEQAHAAAAGRYGSSPTYSFVRGPDGVSYAVSGEVKVDTSPIPGDPEATLRKAQQLRRAANAPAEPSGQDAQVAAQAASMELEARAQLREQDANKAKEIESSQDNATAEEVALTSELDQASAAREQEEQELIREEKRLQAEQDQFEEEQRLLDQRQARAELFNETSRRNIDINRRLIEIGVMSDNYLRGSLLDKSV